MGTDTRRARQLAAQYTLAEASSRAESGRENWGQWVPEYLEARYANPLSLARLKVAWKSLSLFLEEKDIQSPRALTREICLSYLAWRAKPDRAQGKFTVCHNTAVMEIKDLSMLMSEAVRRGYTLSNPCRDLGLKLKERRIRPEFTDGDLLEIQRGIEREPEPRKSFLKVSFLIARYQGCRITETWLNPMTDVDIEGGMGRIRFNAKGGKTHLAPLHPKLIPLFTEMKARGQAMTYPKQTNRTLWHHFLKRIGLSKRLPNACFHSLRVTAASRMARSKIPESHAMRVLGHASSTIHRSYQRVKLEDLDDAMKALS